MKRVVCRAVVVGVLATLASSCDGGGPAGGPVCTLTGCSPVETSVAPSGGDGPVPAGYPAAPATGANFSLVVDGASEHDMGGLGAWLVDDPVPANRYYQIDGETTIVSVPALDIGAYSFPTKHVDLTLKGNDLYFPDALTVYIDGNSQSYVWGHLGGVLEGASTSPFSISGTFSAFIARP
ncbi:MAG TPA: hypothetical protein VK989_02460 [Polyangia bacterium]|jgi:hypothetical protein|nr:hypothetical protein [Polyangia bacterium]